MKTLKLAAVSLNQTPMDWDGNFDRIKGAFKVAVSEGAAIVCFPELCITGYGCEDQFHSEDLQHRALENLIALTTRISDGHEQVLCVGLPFLFRNALYNVIAVVQEGKLLGLVAKQHLAGDGLHYEPRWFRPWPVGCIEKVFIPALGEEVPMGDLQFDFQGIRVGFEICEDAWVAERPGAKLARKGVDIILNPSASHFAFGKHEIRKRFVIEGSRAFGCTYVYANLLGNEAGRAIYDGGCLIATGGTLVAEESRFSMSNYEMTFAVVDISATRTQQSRTASFEPVFKDEGMIEVGSRMLWTNDAVTSEIRSGVTPKLDEFSSAIVLGLFDYLRKSRSRGFVISLSGGADSAACAALVALMVRRGLDSLGPSTFWNRLGMPELVGCLQPVKPLLTCMYQGAASSSETTRKAAEEVAADLGAKFVCVDIGPIVEMYTSMISQAFGRQLTWESDDLTLQNIQARSRAPSIWMVANMEHKLLITTSNRSEAAVGYCTMDGDTAGSIAPVSGVDKHFLRQWLRHIEPLFPSLKYINCQAPTAELRPGEAQTDEDDLMPYDVLNNIEALALLEKKSPHEVFLRMRPLHPQIPPDTLAEYVTKYFTLWCRNQWKRERYALGFHVDNRNLDPRSWCRFPVLSGAFDEELDELMRQRL